ncbi:MAG: PEGA domain-containing protein [Pseudohongiellaceae bacterium]
MVSQNDSNVGGATDPIVPIDFTPNRKSGPDFKFRLRWIHVFVAVFLFASGVAGWFILTARSVYIDAEPITAEVSIEGGPAIRIGQRYLMRPGMYEIALGNEGYYDTDERLLVSSDQSQTHRFAMRKLPGVLNVSTGGVEGARVLIDAVDVGTTPLSGLQIEPGTHELTIESARYLSFRKQIEIEGRTIEQNEEVNLDPAWAVVNLSSSPSGAEVLVDGEAAGSTPLTAELLQGDREITIRLAGHKAWQDHIEISAGEDLSLPDVELEPADGLVFIQSVPTGAGVTINGEFRGQTPLQVALQPDAQHTVALFKNGYEAATTTLQTASGEERGVTLPLDPIMTQVNLAVQPEDAEVYVNGQYRGPADQPLELMAASQTVEIRKRGYVPYTTEFTSRPGLDQQLRVTLQTVEEARLEQIEPVITTAVGQKLKLFYPGEFTMGASRREPGRRPNETLRNIVLEKPFYMAVNEVTNAEFREFRSQHSSGTLRGSSLDLPQQPVVQVGWQDAALFCNWLSERESLPLFYNVENGEVTGFNPAATGYRLPTEAEWAWVARVDDDGNTRRYPWGDQLPPPAQSGNFADMSTAGFLGEVIQGYQDNFLGTANVGTFPANHKDIHDLAGNVAEWVHDFYGSVGVIGDDAEVDPLGPDAGEFHTIRGSSWAHGALTELRLSFRDFGVEPRQDLGFRIARYLEE